MPDVIVEDVRSIVRVLLGDISAAHDGSDYGLKVTASDGSTTIIDGNSDVFKLTASGSMTVTAPALSGANYGFATTTVTLTGLGTFTNTPAFFSWVADTVNTTSQARQLGFDILVADPNAAWAAATSGGAVTSAFLGSTIQGRVFDNLDGSNFVVINLSGYNSTGVAQPIYGYYYTCVETAM